MPHIRPDRTLDFAKGMILAFGAFIERERIGDVDLKSAAVMTALELAARQLGPLGAIEFMRDAADLAEGQILAEALQ